MLDLDGFDLSQIEKELLVHPQVGGVILFSRNYESKRQLRFLTKSIRQKMPDGLIAVDQEGGRVQRFRHEFVSLPAFKSYGHIYDKNPTESKKQAQEMAYTMARELIEVGVDMSFSPVLDVDRGYSEVIGDRSFHHDSNIVADLGRAFIQGMHRAGMPATGKHFPGHGAVRADSHKTLPVDQRHYEEIMHEDIQPFLNLNQVLDAVMPAHILYENVDSQPTCFSSFWLQKVLRATLKFEGVIFSDDLSMAGAEFVSDYVTRSEKALDAGCDMILVCNQQEQAIKVLEYLEKYTNFISERRLQNFRKKTY